MKYDLQNEEQLGQILATITPGGKDPAWIAKLTEFLEYVGSADIGTRSSRAFHERIWEDNPVSAIGMGTVNIAAALDDPGFREWFAEESLKAPSNNEEEVAKRLEAFTDELKARLKTFSSRTPYVKIFRVLAALYPRHFTTVADRRIAAILHRALFGKRKNQGPVRRQLDIRRRLDSLLGPVGDMPEEQAPRMTVAWRLFADYVQPEVSNQESEVVEASGDTKLQPLPAAQRRKGLTSIRGGLDTIANALRFAMEGVTRQDLMDHLRTEFPDYRDSTLRTLINILKNEFYVVQEDDGLISPTDRGELFLETNDPDELIPQLLTRTLGVDHVLLALLKNPQSGLELDQLLQTVNPGWTTNFAPRAMLKWLRDFGLLEVDTSGLYSLTKVGAEWAQSIHWEPDCLAGIDKDELELAHSDSADFDITQVDLDAVRSTVVGDTAFNGILVEQLHFGLWANKRRHFAILAGLSGSGKTLLAMRYASALAKQFTETHEHNRFIQAVQPGWYDPAPLFGYVNPLTPDKYERPLFLDFLLRAARYPDQAFIVILDEMNLSHPEQYFAPVLSAMESGEPLRLHNEGDAFDGVPAQIPYPSNIAFIGTVNMDETTHGISDKVLDRAYTLEFWDIDLDSYPHWSTDGLDPSHVKIVKACLLALMASLAPERLHFGWRTVEDILSYLHLASQSPGFDLTRSLDDVLYARVLPKLRGTESHRLHVALESTLAVLDANGLKRSSAKVSSMKADLADTGMMRFWR